MAEKANPEERRKKSCNSPHPARRWWGRRKSNSLANPAYIFETSEYFFYFLKNLKIWFCLFLFGLRVWCVRNREAVNYRPSSEFDTRTEYELGPAWLRDCFRAELPQSLINIGTGCVRLLLLCKESIENECKSDHLSGQASLTSSLRTSAAETTWVRKVEQKWKHQSEIHRSENKKVNSKSEKWSEHQRWATVDGVQWANPAINNRFLIIKSFRQVKVNMWQCLGPLSWIFQLNLPAEPSSCKLEVLIARLIRRWGSKLDYFFHHLFYHL